MKFTLFARYAVIVAAAVALASCRGGGGTGGVLPQTNSGGSGVQPYSGPSNLTFGWGSDMLAHNATYLGPATIPGKIMLNVEPRLQNEAGLLTYARETADRNSGNYRHWLTPQQIGTMFGASSAAIAATAKYFQGYHLSVGTWPQHLIVAVSGTQANVEAAFGTKFGEWQVLTPAGIKRFYAPQPGSPPHFSTAIPVLGVQNLIGLALAHTYIERPADVENAGYTAPIVRNGFDYSGMINAGYDGTGINLGIVGTGPISPADITAYAQLSGNTRVGTVVQKNVVAQAADSNFDPDPAGLATPPPVTSPAGCGSDAYGPGVTTATCNEEDGEAQLDTEQQAGMAPGATVNFYLAFNDQDCGPDYYDCGPGYTGVEGIYLVDDEIQQVIADDIVDALSLSYGEGEPAGECTGLGCYYNSSGVGPGPDEFAALASEGVTVFASSGDNGAYECDDNGYPEDTKCAAYPATDVSVVAVGGVTVPLTNSGQLQPGTEITAWADNVTYGGDGYEDNSPGSGGGTSYYFAAPAWQATLGASKRETPDISLTGDPNTGPLFDYDMAFAGYAGYGPVGGTSVAAPEAAAMFADFLSACKANATCAHAHGSGANGYRWGIAANAAFYAIATAQPNFGKQAGCEGGSSGAFYNVCAGSNGVVSASPSPPALYPGYPGTPGYNEVNGLGAPFGGFLANEMFAYCGCGTLNLP